MSSTHTATDIDLDLGTVTIDGNVHVIDWFDAEHGFATEIHTTDGLTVTLEAA